MGYVLISPGPFVNRLVILDQSELSIFLFDEEEVGCVWAPGFSYGASLQMFLDEVVNFLNLFLVKR